MAKGKLVSGTKFLANVFTSVVLCTHCTVNKECLHLTIIEVFSVHHSLSVSQGKNTVTATSLSIPVTIGELCGRAMGHGKS